MDDAGIVRLFQSRDERAISEAGRKYGGYCGGIALNLLGVREDAEECVSDAMYAAWRRIPPEEPRSLKAFLGRMTRNAAVDRYRARTAQKRGGGGMEVLLSELDECVPSGGSLDELVERRALSGLISGWLDTLPAGERALFVRRYWYGEGVAELARECGCAPQRLSQRLLRLRRKLKTYLEAEGAEV